MEQAPTTAQSVTSVPAHPAPSTLQADTQPAADSDTDEPEPTEYADRQATGEGADGPAPDPEAEVQSAAEPVRPTQEEAARAGQPASEMAAAQHPDAATQEPGKQPLPFQADTSRLDRGLEWAYCGPPPESADTFRLAAQPDPYEPVEMEADSAQIYRLENRASMQGNVIADRGHQHLETESIDYMRDTGQVHAEGGALLQQSGMRILSRTVDIDLIGRQAHLDQAHFRLEGMNARGTADHIHIESETLSHFTNITYTTCPRDSNAWELQADTLTVDRTKAEAVAHDARLRVNGVPILYTPYISLPLDDRRKSGFLAPSIGNSSSRGVELRAPYYFNIAPDMDATLIPRYMSKRGFMLGGEYRYLTANQHGEFYGEYIHDDQEYIPGDSRGAFAIRQQGYFDESWKTEVNFNLVSDNAYLEDFGNELNVTSTRHLERRADLIRYGEGWFLLARTQGFQTVDRAIPETEYPYKRLPQLLYMAEAPGSLYGSDPRLEAEYVYFDHNDKVHGNRFALRPSISLPLRRSYGHLTPTATLHHASYILDDQDPGLSDSPSLTVPTLSLDGGLIYERPSIWLGEATTQTLEPRLYYLYAPYEDQDDLPVFDSAELDFSFASLFRDNRFSGRDRVGDANQLTLALTSRTLSDQSGRELFRASLGQIFYFEDRRVQLLGAPEEDSSSAVAAELAARIADDWSGRGSIQWDPNRSDDPIRKANFGLHYHGPHGRLVNLSYRLNRDDSNFDTDYEDTDLSFRLPVNHEWEVVGRWLYSLRHKQTQEAFAGVEYGQCCWRVRALLRQFVNSPAEDEEFSFLLQFELAGLGAFGNDIQDFLKRGVYGYEVE